MGGSLAGSSILDSSTSARRLASASPSSGSKRPASARAWRLISARPSKQRQTRSGFRVMKE